MGDSKDPMEVLKGWLISRVVSSFKCKPEQGDALGNNETSLGAINQFFGDEECQRLLVYAAPDLTAVRAPILPPTTTDRRVLFLRPPADAAWCTERARKCSATTAR